MNEKNEKNKRKYTKAGVGFGAVIGILFISVLLVLSNVSEMVEPTVEKEKVWQKVHRWTPLGAEGNPGAGASGFLEIFFMNISSDNATGYGLNTSSTHETWSDANMPGATPNAYANADEFDIEDFESEKTFVIMVRTRYNKTHAWDTDKFIDTDTDCQITVTCNDWAVGANINNASGEKNVTRNNTGEDYIWINWIWDNSGTGYQIADDAILTTSEIYIEARF